MAKAGLIVIVPSRGRPGNIERLAREWVAHSSPESRMVVAVDDDDPLLPQYKAVGCFKMPAFHLRVGRRLGLGGTLNEVAAEYWGTYRYVGFMGDDHLPRTYVWDQSVAIALDRLGAGIVYGDDLLQGPQLPTAAFMTSDIPRTLGWMAPPGLRHLYIDNAWMELGQAMDRLHYLPRVVIEHMHPAAGKAPRDAGYDEVNAPEVDAADKAVFERWRSEQLAADVERLYAAGVVS